MSRLMALPRCCTGFSTEPRHLINPDPGRERCDFLIFSRTWPVAARCAKREICASSNPGHVAHRATAATATEQGDVLLASARISYWRKTLAKLSLLLLGLPLFIRIACLLLGTRPLTCTA